jgi:hypothetical protein
MARVTSLFVPALNRIVNFAACYQPTVEAARTSCFDCESEFYLGVLAA